MEFATTIFWRVGTVVGQVAYALWHFPWHFLFDIGIMTFIVYHAYGYLRGTRALRILLGIVILGLGYLAAQRAGLFLTSWLLCNDAELSDYSFAILGEAKTKGRRAFVTGKVTAWPLAGRRGQQQSLKCSQRRRGGAMRIPQ